LVTPHAFNPPTTDRRTKNTNAEMQAVMDEMKTVEADIKGQSITSWNH